MYEKYLIGLLLLLPAAGCNASEPANGAPPETTATAEKQTTRSGQPPALMQGQAAPAPIAPPTALPSPAAPASNSIKSGESQNKTTAKPAALPAPGPSPKKSDAAPETTMPQEPPPMALAALEQRLKDTDAIGVFTKIALKNQVDDLLKQFQTQYESGNKADLAPLRKNYDQLLAKVHGLLKDGDPALASAIMTSREAIWNALTDPVKFAKL